SADPGVNQLGIAWSKQASYLPDVRSGGGWENTLYVRNSDPTVRPAQGAFSKDNGDILGYLTNPTLAGGALWQASAAFYTTPASAVVDGSEELLAVVRNRSVASNLLRLDNGFRSGVGDPAFEQTATTLYIPVFYRAIYGSTNSTIDVFNPTAQGTSVTFEFRGRSGYGDHTTGSYWVPAGGRLRIEASAVPFSPWVGSVRIVAGQPVAATVSERNAVFERSFNAAAAGHRLQYVPAAYKNAWNLTTGLLVQNVGSSTVNVTFTFCERLVTNPNTCPTHTINGLAPLRAIGLNLENVGMLASGWSGSVKITSSDNATPLVTVVNNGLKDASGALVDGYNFNASNYGGRWVYLPYAARNADGRSTGFTLRNVSGGNISGNAHYYDQDGTLRISYPFTLASAQVMGRAQVNDMVPVGWVGSILLEASGPILAIMREDAPNRTAGYNALVLAP
ncbi:MAG: protease, partial [Caldilinea sp.]